MLTFEIGGKLMVVLLFLAFDLLVYITSKGGK